tara:strand:- start:322 stop:741 length:420 start_codon:yes stop_codon:yes gene_type:complete
MWIKVYQGKIPLNPVAMGRPRATKRGSVYTPGTSAKYMKLAQNELDIDIKIDKNIPIKISATYICKRPKSLNRKKDPINRIYKTTKSDIDNLDKMLFDILGKLKVFHDDAQIVQSTSEKYYCAKTEEPATYFTIYLWSL